MKLNIFSDVYWSFILLFIDNPALGFSYYIWLCCVLGEGTLGLRSRCASLWPLPRKRGTFQHLHKCTIWVSSALFLFFTYLKKEKRKKPWCWYFYYRLVRALYTPIIINPFVKILAKVSPTSCHLISRFKKCSGLYIFWYQMVIALVSMWVLAWLSNHDLQIWDQTLGIWLIKIFPFTLALVLRLFKRPLGGKKRPLIRWLIHT